MDLAGLESLLDGHEVAQGIALDQVAESNSSEFRTSARAWRMSVAVRAKPSEMSGWSR